MKHFLRVVTALSTAAAVVAALLLLRRFCGDGVAFRVILPVMIVLAALVHLEFSMLVSRKYAILVWPGVVAGVLHLVDVFCVHSHSSTLAVVFALSAIVLFGRRERPVESLATTLLGFFYVPWLLSYFIMIPQTMGVIFFLYVIAIVKFSDMGGFAVGMLLGRHKLCPKISPNKTWEGLGGSVVAGVIMSIGFMPLTGYSPEKAVGVGVAAALLGTFGDLVESRFKREVDVKDSATFMPAGLGGFLDMFDSLVFAPAVMYAFL